VSVPSGTVTFLFTDVEGSTRLWEAAPDAMRQALTRHDDILRDAIGNHGGSVFATGGDGFGAAFSRAGDALAAAVAAQVGLTREHWPDSAPLNVRMGLHTGEVEERGGDYFGAAVNRAARLTAVAHGGQILCSKATADLARGHLAEGVSLIDLSEHRLRDLSEPVRVFQVCQPELASGFPPLRSVDAFPGNLPLQMSSFIGRGQALQLVGTAVTEHRLVTLTGVGGVGKTRLALQASADLLPRFLDGAWLVPLAAVRDPDRVADMVAGVFRVTARPGLSVEESLVLFLHDQRLLLLLDNCEHLLRPVASLVARIEEACPAVRVLATSREGLGLRGEQILVVPSLGLPEDESDPEKLVGYEAVQLFIDRARLVKATFAIDASNAEGVQQICTRLDGLPLAIELAAARIPAMNPTELSRRLDQRFRLLTGGDRMAVERQQTLRATIDWSYDLCSESERSLLARLSVFAGGCTLEAVEAVCAAPVQADEIMDVVSSLVARSLVVADDRGLDTRYRLLETIRQYGVERLAEAGETESVRARHADYYISFAAKVTPHMFGPGALEWGIRFAAEHDNLHAAMAFALGSRDLERAMALFCHMPYDLYQINDIVVFDPEPILALPGAGEHPGYPRALVDAARRAFEAAEYQRSLQLVDQAQAAVRRLGPAPGYHDVDALGFFIRAWVAEARFGVGDLAFRLEAAERERAAGHPGLAANAMAAATNAIAWQEPDLALATETLNLARRSGWPVAINEGLITLALTLAPRDPEQARRLFHEGATTDYDNGALLAVICFAAGRFGEWSVLSRTARRLLHLERRTGGIPRLWLGGILNLVARSLAVAEPEAAAVVQGGATALITPSSGRSSGPVETPPRSDGFSEMMTQIRRETTAILIESIGQQRMRELRAKGAAMDRDRACAYARSRIDNVAVAEPGTAVVSLSPAPIQA
jgi:predicted ATPase/class 3 adenylate cyclase